MENFSTMALFNEIDKIGDDLNGQNTGELVRDILKKMASNSYNRVDDSLTVVEGSGSGDGEGVPVTDLDFVGNKPITAGIPGLQGFNPNARTVKTFLSKTFYPDAPPSIQLVAENEYRMYSLNDFKVKLTVIVGKGTNAISYVAVNGQSVTINSSGVGYIDLYTGANEDTEFTAIVRTVKGEERSSTVIVRYMPIRARFYSYNELLSLDNSAADISDNINTLFSNSLELSKSGVFPVVNRFLDDEYFYFLIRSGIPYTGVFINGLGYSNTDFRIFNYTNPKNFTSQYIIVRSKTRLNANYNIETK